MPDATATSLTLLGRLRTSPSPADWDRFHALYAPLLRAWVARLHGPGADADDLTQDVFLAVVRDLPRFERRRDGSFRAWLRATLVHRVRNHWRQATRGPATGTGDYLDGLADPANGLSAQWDREHDRHVTDRLLAAVRTDFEPATWDAFSRHFLGGEPAAAVAATLGVTANAVLLAKSRVLRRLRQEAGELLD